MDKKLVIPTAGLLLVAIATEAVRHHQEPEPHIEAPTLVIPTPVLPPLPTGMSIHQIT